MKGLFRDNLLEGLVGLLVVVLAVWFVVYAWQRTGGGLGDTISVTASFPAANGVTVGTDVRIAGMRVGTVAAQRLDPESYQAELRLALDRNIPIPSDSSAAITAEGLLGGTHVALLPGGSDVPLKNGDAIFDTQGSVDMMSLIGSVINRSGGEGGDAPAAASAEGGISGMDEPPAQ